MRDGEPLILLASERACILEIASSMRGILLKMIQASGYQQG